jgi:hypothetical protein
VYVATKVFVWHECLGVIEIAWVGYEYALVVLLATTTFVLSICICSPTGTDCTIVQKYTSRTLRVLAQYEYCRGCLLCTSIETVLVLLVLAGPCKQVGPVRGLIDCTCLAGVCGEACVESCVWCVASEQAPFITVRTLLTFTLEWLECALF